MVMNCDTTIAGVFPFLFVDRKVTLFLFSLGSLRYGDSSTVLNKFSWVSYVSRYEHECPYCGRL